MIITTKPQPKFAPIEVVITVESQQELDTLWHVFNHTQIIKRLGFDGNEDTAIREVLQKAGAQQAFHSFHEFSDALKK